MELVRKDTTYASESEGESNYTLFESNVISTPLGSTVDELTFSKGRIRSMQLCNFKSYRGIVHVGPFTQFCAIVGHNGSGKSNLLDAIAFVLCIKSPNFKGNLSDLICKCDEELPAAYVEIHLTDSPEAAFRRSVTSKNIVTYAINGQSVTLKQYHEALLNYKIDAIGNSSLVFQGAIISVANRTPVEMSRLFDLTSGSYLLEPQYKELKSNIGKLETEYHDMCVKKNHLEKQAKRYRQMSNNESEFKKLLSKQNKLVAEKYKWEVKELDNRIAALNSSMTSKRREIEQLLCNMSIRRMEIDKLEDQRMEREMQYTEAQEKKLEMKRKKLAMKLKIERAKAERLSFETAKNEAMARTESIKLDIHTAQTNIQSLKDEEAALSSKIESLECNSGTDEFSKIFSKIDWQLYRNVESHLSVELGEERIILRTLQRKLDGEKLELKSARNTLDREKKRLDEFNDKSGKMEKLFSELQLKVTRIDSEITTSQKTLQLTFSNTEKLKAQIKDKERELTEARNLSSLSDLYREESVVNHERLQVVRRMTASVPGVCGLLSTLFQIESEKNIVLKALSANLNLVVVEDYQVSLSCIEWLKTCKYSYRGYLELLSLDKLHLASRGWKGLKNMRGNRYLIDCITFEERYSTLFEQLLGNYIIVKDLQTAYMMDKSDYNSCNVYITEKGEIIRGKTITFDVGASDWLIKEFEVANYSARSEKVKQLERELGQLEESLFQSEMDSQNLSGKIEKLKWELKISESKLDVCRKPVEFNQQEKLIIQQSIQSWFDRVEELNDNLAKLEEKINLVNKRIEIVEFEAFRPISESLGVNNIADLHRKNLETLHQRSLEIDRFKARLAQIPSEITEIQDQVAKLQNKLNNAQREIDNMVNNNNDDDALASIATMELDDKTSDEEDSESFNNNQFDQSLMLLQQKDFEDGKRMEELKLQLASSEANLESLQSDRANLIIKIRTEIGEGVINDDCDLIAEPSSRELERVQNRLEELCGYGDYSFELSKVESALSNLKNDISRVKGAIGESKDKFYQLGRKRKIIFLDFLSKINRTIPQILHTLLNTGDSSGIEANYADNIFQISNTIDHSADEEPFYCPIYYNFSFSRYHLDISVHSGGEKSIAGLALILAFQKVKGTPFVILDEIDAHVDAFYINGIINYFKDCGRQIIAISLKDKLFNQADSLIGVFKNRTTSISRVVTLDLTKYQPVEEDKPEVLCIEDV